MITLKINMVTTQELLFTIADSLIYEIKSDDVYEDFSEGKKMFDFSTCSDKSKYYDEICLDTN